ncbi:MAG: hypothetical protein V1875_03985 [Candidatus Altiarchaeota archaeon]
MIFPPLTEAYDSPANPGWMDYSDLIGIDVTGNSTVNATLSARTSSGVLHGRVIGGINVAVYIDNGPAKVGILNSTMLSEDPPELDKNLTGLIELINTSSDSTGGIVTVLEYNDGTPYDADDDGVEYEDSAIDYSAGRSNISTDANYERLCTVWEIYSVYSGNLTTICYGYSPCCGLYGISSMAGTRWNDTFYLPHGGYSATKKNIVGARVAYADVGQNEENASYRIYKGQWEFKPAFFYEPRFIFKAPFSRPDPESAQLLIETDAAESLRVYLDRIEYAGPGGITDYQQVGVKGVVASVTEPSGGTFGHYEARYAGDALRMLFSSKPRQTNVSAHLIEGSRPTEEVYDDWGAYGLASTTHANYEAVMAGFINSQDNLTVIFGQLNDPLLTTGAAYFTPGLSFDNLTVTLPKLGNVSIISVCTDLNFTSMECRSWTPLTSDFRQNDENVTFVAKRSGLFAGVGSTFLDSMLDYSGSMRQGTAQLNKPVTWSTEIRAMYGWQLSFNIVVTTPLNSFDVALLADEDNKALHLEEVTETESDARRFQTQMPGARNYTLRYNTEGPTLKEDDPVEINDTWTKRITITSPTRYSDLAFYTSTPSLPEDRVTITESGESGESDISQIPAYNLTFKDSGSDGTVDWAYLRIPNMANATYTVVGDKRPQYDKATDEHADTRINSDETYSSVLFLEPHGQTINGTFDRFDPSPKRTNEGDYGYYASDTGYLAYFDSRNGRILFGTGSGTIKYAPQSTNQADAVTGGEIVAYYGAWNSTDLEYMIGRGRLTARLNLMNNGSPNEYSFDIEPEKTSVEEGQGISVYDKNGTWLFGFRTEAHDSKGRTINVSETLEKRGGDYRHKIAIDYGSRANITYPATIDIVFSEDGHNKTHAGIGYADNVGVHTPTILPVGLSDSVYRAYAAYDLTMIPEEATILSARMRLYVESPMDGKCSRCVCQIRQITGRGDIFEEAGILRPYASVQCDRQGLKTADLGDEAAADIQKMIKTGASSFEIVSGNESSPDDFAIISGINSPRSRQPALEIDWTTATTTTLPYFNIEDVRTIQKSPRCRYDPTAREYECNASQITVNGTVDLLFEGENASRSIRLNAPERLTISENGRIIASGRDLEYEDESNISRPDGGTVTISGGQVDIYGVIDSRGGDYLSQTHKMNAGSGGTIKITANSSARIVGLLQSSGGDINTTLGEGDFGGTPGDIKITSLGSWVFVSRAVADGGTSNNEAGAPGGRINVSAAQEANVSEASMAGGSSMYDDAGRGGELFIKSGNIYLGCVNATGSDAPFGAGGKGGTITLHSTGDIVADCRIEAYSGRSIRVANNIGGDIILIATSGNITLSDIDAYGGEDLSDGIGGAGGRITISGFSANVNGTLDVRGGYSMSGTGGKGGQITVEYCEKLENESIRYENSGGDGPIQNGTNGPQINEYRGAWCGQNESAPAALPTRTVTLADQATMEGMGLKFTDPLGNQLSDTPTPVVQIRDLTGRRLVEFNVIGDFNLTELKVSATGGKVFVYFEESSGIETTHSIFVRNTRNRGAYVCTQAKNFDEVTLDCPGKASFTHNECLNDAAKDGITCTLEQGDYKISGLK